MIFDTKYIIPNHSSHLPNGNKSPEYSALPTKHTQTHSSNGILLFISFQSIYIYIKHIFYIRIYKYYRENIVS